MKSINVKNTGYAQMLSWNAMIAVRTAHKHMSTCCYPNILCFMTLPLSLLISAFGQTLQLMFGLCTFIQEAFIGKQTTSKFVDGVTGHYVLDFNHPVKKETATSFSFKPADEIVVKS